MNGMTDTADSELRGDSRPGTGTTFKERLIEATSDYETLDAENVVGVGV